MRVSRAPTPVVLALLVAGCATALERRTLALPPAATRETPSAAELVRSLSERQAALESLAGTAKVGVRLESLESGKPHHERLRGTQAVLAHAPASFRFEALSPFGVAYVVASNGIDLATYLPGERLVYRGAATAETIGAATGVMAEARDVVALLLGRPPVTELDAGSASVSPAGGGATSSDSSANSPEPDLFLHGRSAGGAVVIGFGTLAGGARVPVLFERLAPSGEPELQARFAEFDVAAPLPVAKLVEVATPGIEASLRYTDLTLNPATPDERFVLVTPPGAREVPYELVQEGAAP